METRKSHKMEGHYETLIFEKNICRYKITTENKHNLNAIIENAKKLGYERVSTKCYRKRGFLLEFTTDTILIVTGKIDTFTQHWKQLTMITL